MVTHSRISNQHTPDENEQSGATQVQTNEHDDIETVVSDNETIEPIPRSDE